MLPEPYYHDAQAGITLYCGDCRDILPRLPDGGFDLFVTDPPYGIHKAGWDSELPLFWLNDAARITRRALVIMPGIHNILSLPRDLPPFQYRWMLSVHLSNGMTRGKLGFGNWIAALVYGRDNDSLYRPQQDATVIPVGGEMPNHPSPKPLRAVTWMLSRFDEGMVIDPFCGSGTTLVAAKWLGYPAVGIELDESYCAETVRRLRQAVLPFETEAAG